MQVFTRVTWEEGTSAGIQVGLWACVGRIVLITVSSGKTQPIVGKTFPGLVDLDYIIEVS